MIRAAEIQCEEHVDAEKRKLADELEHAVKHAKQLERERREEIVQKAKQELRQEKERMGKILEQGEVSAQTESAALERAASRRKTETLSMLTQEFLNLLG